MDSERKPLNPECTPPVETPQSNRSTWLSVYIASALSFVSAVQYSMYFSSIWPYQKELDPTITENFFGYIVAIYSAGQIISSPLFGYWSNRIRQVRIPIIVGMMMMFVGNAIYLCLELARPNSGKLLLVGRFIMGFGSGNIVLMRSYAAMAVGESERARALTFVTCGQAVGLTIGPAAQMLFLPFHYPGFTIISKLRFNTYTAPAFFSNLMNFLGTCAMVFYFDEKFAGMANGIPDNDNDRHMTLPPYDLTAMTVCLVTRFTYMFINTNLETVGSPYSMMMFGWTGDQTVRYTSIAQGVIGFLTLLVYIVLIYFKLDKRINYRVGSIIGLSVMILFHVVTYSWPFLPGKVTMTSELHDEDRNGCDDKKFSWCKNLKPVNVWFYYSTYILALGLAFPILNIGNTTLFSDILGPRRQGTQQGILQMSGGAARLIGPIVISVLYSECGPTMAWSMEILVIFITLVLWFVFFKRLVPLVPTYNVDHKVSVVDVVPDPSALSSSSQVHSVPRKSKTEIYNSLDQASSIDRTLRTKTARSALNTALNTTTLKTSYKSVSNRSNDNGNVATASGDDVPFNNDPLSSNKEQR